MLKELKQKYENIIIISLKIGEEKIKEVVEKFKNLISSNASLTDFNEWGKRKLAYPINYETEGYYVLFNFESGLSFPEELVRQCRIDDSIIRFMVVTKTEGKKKQKQKVNSL